MTNLIKQLEKEQLDKLNKTVPDFKAGDTVRVMCKIIEAEGRERLQAYEGVCIARKNDGLNSTFTVRKISFGEGVERVFPLYSPNVAEIKVLRRGKVARAPNCITCAICSGNPLVLKKKTPKKRNLTHLNQNPQLFN